MKSNTGSIRETFWKDGYVKIKAVFDKREITNLRKYILNIHETYPDKLKNKDLMLDSVIRKYLLDSRVISIVKEILTNKVTYFGDSSCTLYENHKNVGSYHKDCTDRLDPNAPDWQSPYPLIRVALFLQDHKKQGGGVILGKKSHNHLFKKRSLQVFYEEVFGLLSGNFKYIDSEIGDLVIWNLRTTHCPLGKYIKYSFKRPVSGRLNKLIPDFCKKSFSGKRLLLQTTYGSKSKHLNRYIDYLKTRSYMVERWSSDKYNLKIKNDFKRNKIELYDFYKSINKQIKLGNINAYAKWKPFPY